MRFYELLEASYTSMIDKLIRDNPTHTKFIKDELKWAKTVLKKDDKIIWYMKYIQAEFIQKNITNTNELHDNLGHFFGYDYKPIHDYQFTNKTYEQIIKDLQRYEKAYNKILEKNKPIKMQQDDYVLIDFEDSAWIYHNRAYCQEIGTSGRTCGNVVGKTKKDQRLLTYQKPIGHVQLTFVLEPNHYLGEMKFHYNNKPGQQFHPVIMKLLMNDIVKGISSGGFQAHMNFSIFDLDDQQIKFIEQHKPNLITTQIDSTPFEFVKAPNWIVTDPKYQQIAINKMPALKHLLTPTGFDTSIDNWERAIEEDPKLIIRAPEQVSDYEERVIQALDDPEMILASPRSITDNYNIMSDVIANNPDNIAAINTNNKNYKKLAYDAISSNSDGSVLQSIPEEIPEYYDLCKFAVKNYGAALEYVSEDVPNYYELCKIAVNNSGWALEVVPEDLRDYDLCKIAVSNLSDALMYVPEDIQDYELCKIAVSKNGNTLEYVEEDLLDYDLCKIAVSTKGLMLQYVPDDLRDYELCKIALNNDGYALTYVPPELRDYDLCKIAVSNGCPIGMVPRSFRDYELSKIAVKNNRNELQDVPTRFWHDIKKQLGID